MAYIILKSVECRYIAFNAVDDSFKGKNILNILGPAIKNDAPDIKLYQNCTC